MYIYVGIAHIKGRTGSYSVTLGLTIRGQKTKVDRHKLRKLLQCLMTWDFKAMMSFCSLHDSGSIAIWEKEILFPSFVLVFGLVVQSSSVRNFSYFDFLKAPKARKSEW